MKSIWRFRNILGVACLGAACTASTWANTVPISNTGLTSVGGLQASGGVDGNYTLVAYPVADGTNTSIVAADGAVVYPHGSFPLVSGPWVADTSTAQWITQEDFSQGIFGGIYIYQTTFTLSSPGAVTLTGAWATDNNGVGIFINQSPVSIIAATTFTTVSGHTEANINNPGTCFGCFGALTPFTVSGKGVAGLNTVDFEVFNGLDSEFGNNNPSGLIVDNLSLSATPEPAFYGVLAIGVAGLFAAVRRRGSFGK